MENEVTALITKTISGHYDTAFSIEHNNRVFTPGNVDPDRTRWNYNCVAAGQLAPLDLKDPVNLSAFWQEYRVLSELYWEDRKRAKKQAYKEYMEQMERMKRYRRALDALTDDGIFGIISLLFLPLLIPCDIVISYQMTKAKEEYLQMKDELWERDQEFKEMKMSFCEAIYQQDLTGSSDYLKVMDCVVMEMARQAKDYTASARIHTRKLDSPARCATLEEIYDKLYEPAFRTFQDKQRPCRRDNRTYLESIREGRAQESKKKQQSKNTKSRKTAEAIEIVFGIGDMDNTGYAAALEDARRAEVLLKDFCDHLLENPNLCVVTTKELEDLRWIPPFRNGLLVLNLTVHCDEATPGVHLTCIPYSRGCKRGPAVQAALGRAMTGMGYPSTWTNALDKEGNPIPKRTRAGELVYNQDGTIRYRQEPDKQGIIDWIEEQKHWIQMEMEKRYQWKREYKGAHARGNLSTPDYKVARAKERKEELERISRETLETYKQNVIRYSSELHRDVMQMLEKSSPLDKVLFYLNRCPEEEYQNIMRDVNEFWSRFAVQEGKKVLVGLYEQIAKADKKAAMKNEQTKRTHSPDRGK